MGSLGPRQTCGKNEIGNATFIHRSPAVSEGRAIEIVCEDILSAFMYLKDAIGRYANCLKMRAYVIPN